MVLGRVGGRGGVGKTTQTIGARVIVVIALVLLGGFFLLHKAILDVSWDVPFSLWFSISLNDDGLAVIVHAGQEAAAQKREAFEQAFDDSRVVSFRIPHGRLLVLKD